MTDDGVPDLDTLFGFKEMPVGLGDFKLKVRAMLTRKQTRAVAGLHTQMLKVHKQLVELIDAAGEMEATPDSIAATTVEAEAVEDRLIDICIRGLEIICISPPSDVLAQLTITDLASLFARAGIEQGTLTAESIAGETGHPTSASSAS